MSKALECTNSEGAQIPFDGISLGATSVPRRGYLREYRSKGKKKHQTHSWLPFPLAKNSNGLTILMFMATQTTLFEKSLISMIAVDMFSSTEQFRRKKLFY